MTQSGRNYSHYAPGMSLNQSILYEVLLFSRLTYSKLLQSQTYLFTCLEEKQRKCYTAQNVNSEKAEWIIFKSKAASYFMLISFHIALSHIIRPPPEIVSRLILSIKMSVNSFRDFSPLNSLFFSLSFDWCAVGKHHSFSDGFFCHDVMFWWSSMPLFAVTKTKENILPLKTCLLRQIIHASRNTWAPLKTPKTGYLLLWHAWEYLILPVLPVMIQGNLPDPAAF